MVTGHLIIMGEIETVEDKNTTKKHPMALLIEFDSAEDIRAALNAMECKFEWSQP